MVYKATMSAGSEVLPSAQFNKTGALSASTKPTFIELVEDVETANGTGVVVMGTRTALSKLQAILIDPQWATDGMKEEMRATGRVSIAEGITMVEIPQAFAPNDTSKKLVDNTKLLVMPVADNRFIKIYNEGDAQIKEVNDNETHNDETIDYEYKLKMGVGTVIGRKFGVWNITA